MRLDIYIRPGHSDGWVQAYSPDVPGLSAVGRTGQEALDNINKRLASTYGSTWTLSTLADARHVQIDCYMGPGKGGQP